MQWQSHLAGKLEGTGSVERKGIAPVSGLAYPGEDQLIQRLCTTGQYHVLYTTTSDDLSDLGIVVGAGLEVLVFCSLLVVFLLAGCTVSLCRSKITRDLLSAAVTTSQPHHSTLTMQTPAQIMGPTPAPVVPEPPPPPYHIAVLLPHQNNAQQSTDDSPPPSYEKAIS
uniref:Uncharacterized protein n=1 Tax=Timema monikensis TaxID=170555 RepID=A0A7R9E602_9NEOP|nr:unnamed protein product [Timema monikensis]